jgi:hypothetical protein
LIAELKIMRRMNGRWPSTAVLVALMLGVLPKAPVDALEA